MKITYQTETTKPTTVPYSEIKDWQTFTHLPNGSVYIKLPVADALKHKEGGTSLCIDGDLNWTHYTSLCYPGPMVTKLKFEY